MARNTVPMMKSGSILSKLVGWVVTALIVLLAIQHPAEAGQVVTTVLTWLHTLIAH